MTLKFMNVAFEKQCLMELRDLANRLDGVVSLVDNGFVGGVDSRGFKVCEGRSVVISKLLTGFDNRLADYYLPVENIINDLRQKLLDDLSAVKYTLNSVDKAKRLTKETEDITA